MVTDSWTASTHVTLNKLRVDGIQPKVIYRSNAATDGSLLLVIFNGAS